MMVEQHVEYQRGRAVAMSFYNTVLRNSPSFRSDAICRDPALLEPGTRKAVMALMVSAKAEGVDIRLLETYRSQTRQSALYVKKATQLRTVGCHGYGVAADFGIFVDGKYATSSEPYMLLRHLARDHGLISGLDWGKAGPISWDAGHVQRVPVWRQSALLSGSWYPPENYDPYADSEANGRREVVRNISLRPPAVASPKKVDSLVTWLQRMLNRAGALPQLAVDGDFGPKTKGALVAFQNAKGLPESGVTDASTVAALREYAKI